jgi:aminopeptidase 2
MAIIEDEALRQRLERFGRWLCQPGYDRLGWEAQPDEGHFDTLLRPVVLAQAVRFELPGTSEEGLRRFGQYVKTGDLDPNIRSAVLYSAARFGNAAQYDELLALYLREVAPHSRQAQLVTLGRFRAPELAQRTLDLALSNKVRPQDVVYGLAGVWRARENRELAWRFLQQQWPEFVRRFGDGGHMLDRFPDFAGGAFATHAKAKEVADFFAAHPHVAITRPAAQAVEAIELKADWFDRSATAITTFLDDWEAQQLDYV